MFSIKHISGFHISRFQRLWTTLIFGLWIGYSLLSTPAAFATDLPPGVWEYLRKKDPDVSVRFDGLITFSNGESYLPILPQDFETPANPTGVLRQDPEKVAYPDLVQFDNNIFLIRIIKLGGEKTSEETKMTVALFPSYPVELKSGMLPQDLILPNNLFFPAELKVILGDLPYNPGQAPPTESAVNQAVNHPTNPASPTKPGETPKTPQTGIHFSLHPHMTAPAESIVYLSTLNAESLIALDPTQKSKQTAIALECMPYNTTPSSDGSLLYVSCLNADELLVVDTRADLIKTRVSVGSKPGKILNIPSRNELVVSNRFSKFISLIDADNLVGSIEIPLEGFGGAMTYSKKINALFVADTARPMIYVVDLSTQNVVKTMAGLRNMTAIWINDEADENPSLWIASRTAHEVMNLHIGSGDVLNRFTVGKKPVAFAPRGDFLYVVSANEDQIDVINWRTKTLDTPIKLTSGSFPSDITFSQKHPTAYVSAAGANEVYVVNLENKSLEKVLKTNGRTVAISLVEGPSVEAPKK